jgi:hypothetical protein
MVRSPRPAPPLAHRHSRARARTHTHTHTRPLRPYQSSTRATRATRANGPSFLPSLSPCVFYGCIINTGPSEVRRACGKQRVFVVLIKNQTAVWQKGPNDRSFDESSNQKFSNAWMAPSRLRALPPLCWRYDLQAGLPDDADDDDDDDE